MYQYKTILIDDEISSLDILEYELKNVSAKIDIIEKCSDARIAAKLIDNEKPDLVFLDIEMPWLSGFEVLDQVSFLDFNLIFVTAYNQYAIKAFKYLAFDYLLKPVNRNELVNTLKRIQSKTTNQQNTALKDVIRLIKNGDFKTEKIPFTTLKGVEFYSLSEIIHCKADSNYTEIYTTNKKKAVISKTLKNVEKLLDNDRFLRVHQSHLINLDHLVSYLNEDGGYLKMSNYTIVPLARSKKTEFFNRINHKN
ncbi:DNA-binding response regulator [Aureibaculum marinum]|uniref:DNA-binding response regulator n=1 Tax=Aureibaculum marinum TaxID=2487930 RepID=A0A3N4NQE9_9FLAO|nr:LytTR family DNA-binding domain-containing protein [Aureibaculum marinum]RPD98511.1 DNA-binding response regulator [Aureibaculum marinum]